MMPPDEKVRFQFAGEAQGTTYRVTYFSESIAVHQEQVDSIFAELDSSLSLYKPYSSINKFNASAEGLKPDEHLMKVVRKSLEISHAFPGHFDITIFPITRAWGFGPDRLTKVPDSCTIQNLMTCVGADFITIEHNFIHKKKPCVALDVNGIAQGYTVDVIAEFLEARNIHDYLVEVGGEIRVNGLKYPERVAMNIGIESPALHPTDEPVLDKIITLPRGAVTTSGNYRRYWRNKQTTVSHLMNSATGYPLQNEMISVTVLTSNAMTADGLDNVLMSTGWKAGLQLLQNYPDVDAYFIYKRNDGTAADTATSGFYKRLSHHD
jgi:thiamine biosynthesis lipoprotein